jgi:PAS domain S-box-containing protein
MTLCDMEGRILQVNAAFCTIADYEGHELIGRNFLSITQPDDIEPGTRQWQASEISLGHPVVESAACG